jgi:hypothetical protein
MGAQVPNCESPAVPQLKRLSLRTYPRWETADETGIRLNVGLTGFPVKLTRYFADIW